MSTGTSVTTKLNEVLAASAPTLASAVKELTSKHITPGVKIGGATFFAKKMVKMAKESLAQKKGGKKWIALIDSRIGEQVAVVLIPGGAFLVAKVFPNQIPGAEKVSAVAGYAVTGATSELIQSFIRKAAPFFDNVAKMAEDLPEDVKNGHVKDREARA